MPVKHIAALTQEQVAVLSLQQMGLAPDARRKAQTRRAVTWKAEDGKLESLATEARWMLCLVFAMLLPLLIAVCRIRPPHSPAPFDARPVSGAAR